MATTTSKLGLTKPSYTDAADVGVLNNNFDILDREVSKRTRAWNLLDNSDFRNPVNQRGQTTITQNFQYLIDRWVANNVDATRPTSIITSGLKLDGSNGSATTSICQYVPNLRDGAYTAAANAGNSVWIVQFTLVNGVYTKTNGYNDGKGQIYISGNGEELNISLQAFAGYSVTFEWGALYEGSYTVETLPEYQPKGYAAELAECQRYCRPFDEIAQGYFITANAIQVEMPLDPPMRTTPTITCKNNPTAYTHSGRREAINPSYAATSSPTKAGYVYYCATAGTEGTPAIVTGIDAMLFADL